jgi:hypothetical protein
LLLSLGLSGASLLASLASGGLITVRINVPRTVRDGCLRVVDDLVSTNVGRELGSLVVSNLREFFRKEYQDHD